jgi:dTDP-4-amino-4,6-dideoxygalactose transaminase
MTEFQAAILIIQLGRLEEQTQRRAASARLLDERLGNLPGLRHLAPAPHMTRRSYHMYAFRVDEEALGISRNRFLEALRAEGVPASEGWYRPLYQNAVFQNAHLGPKHGIRAPLADKGVDYSRVSCPVCEQVCRDAVWIPQNVLLADADQIERLADAIGIVVNSRDMIRETGELGS